jgi:hypothetical protein
MSVIDEVVAANQTAVHRLDWAHRQREMHPLTFSRFSPCLAELAFKKVQRRRSHFFPSFAFNSANQFVTTIISASALPGRSATMVPFGDRS